MLNLTAEEELLLVVANEHRPDRLRETPLRHITTRDSGRLLDVARGTCRYAIAAKDNLLRRPATIAHDQTGL